MARGKSWKNWEAYVCRLFNGKRRGADYADQAGGKNDCIGTPGWSIETKFMARPTYNLMLADAQKAADRRSSPNDIPISVMRKKGAGRVMDTTLVSMRLGDFLEFFGPVGVENEDW